MIGAFHQKMRHHISHAVSRASDSVSMAVPFLNSEHPEDFVFTPRELWDGDAEKGRRLVHGGVFSFKGDQLELHNADWHPRDVPAVWRAYIHGFDWLNDLRALGGDQGRLAARAMIQNWMEMHPHFEPFSWHPGILGQRVSNLIAQYDFFGQSASDAFQRDFFECLFKQVKHLSRHAPGQLYGLDALYAIKALAYAGLTLEGRERDLEVALNGLEREMKTQFFTDGGHVSRNADQLFEALKILIDIRGALKQGGYPALESIQKQLETSLPALRFFRHGDKKFAVFQGVQEGENAPVQQLFQMSGCRAKAINRLPYTGYERLSVGKSLLIMDCGYPAKSPYTTHAHNAPLAFEFSHGRERIFVNCGTHPTDKNWQDALRGAPAHNALILDDFDPCRFDKNGNISHALKNVIVDRQVQHDQSFIDGCHDGYRSLNGILHRRRVTLTAKGYALEGREHMTCPTGLVRAHRAVLRFHLHPRVLVSLVQDGTQALLRLKSGLGFRFAAENAELALENSIYLGDGMRPVKTKQLVLRTLIEEDSTEIGWFLRKE